MAGATFTTMLGQTFECYGDFVEAMQELPTTRARTATIDRTPKWDAEQRAVSTKKTASALAPAPALAVVRPPKSQAKKRHAEATVATQLRKKAKSDDVDVDALRAEMQAAFDKEREVLLAKHREDDAELRAKLAEATKLTEQAQLETDRYARTVEEQVETIQDLRNEFVPSERAAIACSDDEDADKEEGDKEEGGKEQEQEQEPEQGQGPEEEEPVIAVRKMGGGAGKDGTGGNRGGGLVVGAAKAVDAEPTCWGEGGRSARPAIPFGQITDFKMKGFTNEKVMQVKIKEKLCEESKGQHSKMYTQAFLDLMGLPGMPSDHLNDPEACVEFWINLESDLLTSGIQGKKHLMATKLFPTIFESTKVSWLGTAFEKNSVEWNRRKTLRRRMVEYMRAVRNMDKCMNYGNLKECADDDE